MGMLTHPVSLLGLIVLIHAAYSAAHCTLA
jgi:hypothetical protein